MTDVRGGGRDRKEGERKNKNLPVMELNQTLEQLSRPWCIKTRSSMKIQLHDNVTRPAECFLSHTSLQSDSSSLGHC